MNVSWTVMWIDKGREVCVVVDGACVFVSGVYVVESTCVFMMYVMVVVVCVCTEKNSRQTFQCVIMVVDKLLI